MTVRLIMFGWRGDLDKMFKKVQPLLYKRRSTRYNQRFYHTLLSAIGMLRTNLKRSLWYPTSPGAQIEGAELEKVPLWEPAREDGFRN